MGVHEHKKDSPLSTGCAIVTVSDTRSQAEDGSGALIRELLEGAGHTIVGYRIIRDDPEAISSAISSFADDSAVDAVIVNGGTGVSPRDNTYDAVSAVLTTTIDGFGELFRALSYAEIGAAAMLSRALGGLVGTTAVFALPGSSGGCRLGVNKLIIPELGHMVSLANPEKWRGC